MVTECYTPEYINYQWHKYEIMRIIIYTDIHIQYFRNEHLYNFKTLLYKTLC